MTTTWLRVLPVLLPLALLAMDPAHAVTVPPPLTARTEIFTNSAILLTGTEGAAVYYLDGLVQLQRQLSQGLPGNPQAAAEIVKQRARALGPALQARALNASEGITRAAYYGVNRVPAVVFDGHAVVFGVTDIAQARALYERSPSYRGGK